MSDMTLDIPLPEPEKMPKVGDVITVGETQFRIDWWKRVPVTDPMRPWISIPGLSIKGSRIDSGRFVPVVILRQLHIGDRHVRLEGWEDLDKWARRNTALWHATTERASYYALSEDDRLRLLCSELHCALTKTNEMLGSHFHERGWSQPIYRQA